MAKRKHDWREAMLPDGRMLRVDLSEKFIAVSIDPDTGMASGIDVWEAIWEMESGEKKRVLVQRKMLESLGMLE